MLEYKIRSNKKNLVVFIHGFIGGEETWVRKDSKTSIMEYLINDAEFLKSFDIAMFVYFSKVTDFFSKKKGWISRITPFKKNHSKNQKNLEIDDLSDLLSSQIDTKCNDYEKIILIAHSMGGLVSKSYILKSKTHKVELYLSLAVPHNGSNLASLAKIIFGNPQIENLTPLGKTIDKLSRSWLDIDRDLPRTVYFIGKYDDVVVETSAKGFESRKDNIREVNTDDDHFSIITPDDTDSTTVLAVKQECWKMIEVGANNNTSLQSKDSDGQQAKTIQTTQDALMSEVFRKEQIKNSTYKLCKTLAKEFNGIEFFKRSFKDRDNRIISFETIRNEILNSDLVMIHGIGGIGKSLTVKKLILDLSKEIINPFFIYCDGKNWSDRYKSGLENIKSANEQFKSLLDSFSANTTFSDIENLGINRYDQNIIKIIFIDGLNEISSEETGKKITSILYLIQREYNFKIVIVTRHFHSSEYRSFNTFGIEKVDKNELERIINEKFNKDLSAYTSKNIEYLSLPFFLDIAIRTGSDKITEYSSYIYSHVLKGFTEKLQDLYISELANIAYETYNSDQKFIISEKRITPYLEKKFVKTRILIKNGLGYKFEHHLVNEFLVAYKISNTPALWIDNEFDKITFEDKKSYEIIQMIIEQIDDTESGETFLKAVYNWNFYAVLHCIRHVEGKYSKDFALVILLILSEKLFDNFSHTRERISVYLYDLFEKFNLKGFEKGKSLISNRMEPIKRKLLFNEVIESNSNLFVESSYNNWFTIFSSNHSNYSPKFIAYIVDSDPLISWSSSNVFKRKKIDENLAEKLMVLFASSKNQADKWRIVHALGSCDSMVSIDFLFEVLQKNEFVWTSYGALRSILEIALFYQNPNECQQTLDRVLDTFSNSLFDRVIILELLACLIDFVDKEKQEFILSFFTNIESSQHKNFENKMLIESSKQKFIHVNKHQ